jgi:hypothetical protein
MNESTRERDALRLGLLRISSPCPFCDNNGVSLSWSEDRRRYILRVWHAPGCPVLVRPVFRRDASDYLTAILMLHGVPVGDYCESDLIQSHGSW